VWDQGLVSSRLLEYEVWNRIHARGLSRSHADLASAFIGRFSFVELGRDVLTRALEPFPTAVRTLDAIHLASVDYLLGKRQRIELLSYDERMLTAARAMRIPLLSA
jgi:hypothetical protein